MSTNIITCVLLCATSTCLAQDAGTKLENREINRVLDEIIELYGGVASSRMNLTNAVESNATWESIVFDSGQFVVKNWLAKNGADPGLTNIVYAADGTIRGMHGPPRFIEGAMPEDYLDAPGQVHHWTNPWPLLDDWCLAIANDPDRTGTRSGGVTTVKSPELGLSLSFGVQLECLAVDRTLDGYRTRIVFNGYPQTAEQQWLMPARMRRFFFLDPSEPDVARTDDWTFTSVVFNEDNEAQTLVWDPDTIGVYRYDPESKNVYAGDGALLYNETEWAENALGMAGVARTSRNWLVPGLTSLAVLSGAIACWRLRR